MADSISHFISSLIRNGQVLDESWHMSLENKAVVVFISVPERNSLQRKRENKWLKDQRLELRSIGLAPPVNEIVGKEFVGLARCKCASPPSYLLFSDYLSTECPLRCGGCFNVVPLYRIPPTSECENYEDIIFWRRNYQRCDELQMGCMVGERFGTIQMSSLKSDLSMLGLECCRRIKEVTNKPCYYFLYYYRSRSSNPKTRLSCPMCRRPWLLDDPWHGRFHFRCDHCRLLSNLA